MLKFECFVTFSAFEFPKDCALIVADHVPLESVDVGEGFIADLAGLEREKANSLLGAISRETLRFPEINEYVYLTTK